MAGRQVTSERGLECPNCGGNSRLDILETRRKGTVLRRRRECNVCLSRFNTVEVSEDAYERSIKGLDGKTVRALALLKQAADVLRGLPDASP